MLKQFLGYNIKILGIGYRGLSEVPKRYFTPRRALLYIPGSSEKKIQKGLTLNADCLCFDCEDGVAQNQKDVARKNLRALLDKGKPTKDRPYDFGVRINSANTSYFNDDIREILSGPNLPDTLLVPKVDTVDHILKIAENTKKYIETGKSVNLIIFIESAQSFINLVDICKKCVEVGKDAKFKLAGMVLGGDDLAADLGVKRTQESHEMLYARQKLVMVARAYKIQAIDVVFKEYKDLEGFKISCEKGHQLGYTGKQIIHPGQIEIAQNTFIPSEQELIWAEGLLEAFKKHQKEGTGAFNYKGEMIDMPTMKQAQNIIDMKKIIGR